MGADLFGDCLSLGFQLVDLAQRRDLELQGQVHRVVDIVRRSMKWSVVTGLSGRDRMIRIAITRSSRDPRFP